MPGFLSRTLRQIPPSLRVGARLLRITALLLILWALLVFASLAARDLREAEPLSRGTQPPAGSAAMAVAPLGVTVEWEGSSPDDRAAALERIAATGAGWVRLRAGWERIEPEESQYEWGELDAWLAEIVRAGFEPVVVLDGSPRWAQGPLDQPLDNRYAPPAEASDFARFARALANRYAQDVRLYQIWDEPNIAPHWGSRHIDPVGYAQLLIAGASTIRAADADALILTAALAPTSDRGHLAIDEVFFLQRMIAAGAAGSFDAVATQPFGFGFSPTSPRRQIETLNFQRVTLLRRALVDAELAETPIWAVRFGWNTRGDSHWGTVTPADQERYAAEARAVAAQWPWLATLGWAVDQPARPPDDPIWGFALTEGVAAALSAPPPALPQPETGPMWQRLAALLVLAVLAAAATGRELWALPLRRWGWELAARPVWVQAGAWGALLAVYYLATPAPLIVACWLAGMGLALVNPAAGVWLALAALPFYFQHKELTVGLWGWTVPPATAAAILLLPALLREIARRPVSTPRLRWTDAAAVAWLLLSLLSAANVWQWAAYRRGLIELTVVPLLIYAALRLMVRADAQAVRRACGALALGGGLVAALGLVAWGLGSGVEIDGVRRLVGPHYSPNHTALYLLRSLFAAIGLVAAWQGGVRRWGLAAVALMLLALLLTASRGALALGLPAGVAGCIWLWTLRSDLPLGMRVRAALRRPIVRGALAALPLVVLAALFIGEARLLNRESVDSRLILWQTAVRLWRAHPLAGVGPGGFFWSYPAYLPPGAQLEAGLLHPHNSWLELATGWGIGGALWLLAVVGWWLLRAAQRMNTLPVGVQWPAIGLTGALAAALAHAQVDAFLALPDLAGWLFAALGVWCLIERAGEGETTG